MHPIKLNANTNTYFENVFGDGAVFSTKSPLGVAILQVNEFQLRIAKPALSKFHQLDLARKLFPFFQTLSGLY